MLQCVAWPFVLVGVDGTDSARQTSGHRLQSDGQSHSLSIQLTRQQTMNSVRIAGGAGAALFVASILACLWLSIAASTGLVSVTVTALNPAQEPADHMLSLIKQREALPDYEICVLTNQGGEYYLGVKPDESAAKGLTWTLADPISTAQIATVRLREKDKLISDALAEVNVSATPVTSKGYRFTFTTERSLGVGLKAFFTTPLGAAISVGFCIAVILILLAYFLRYGLIP